MTTLPADLPDLPPRSFEKADPSPDALFYAEPRFVAHIDPGAIAQVTALYRRHLPAGGRILDLMSSWISHLPDETGYAHVAGHGLNGDELGANPRLDEHFVQDLNLDPVLPLPDASFDAACLCMSVQYLQNPVAVLREAGRVLRPGAPLVITFSNRCFPTKAVALWLALDDLRRLAVVSLYLERAGFVRIETGRHAVAGQDPVMVAIGRIPEGRAPAGQVPEGQVPESRAPEA